MIGSPGWRRTSGAILYGAPARIFLRRAFTRYKLNRDVCGFWLPLKKPAGTASESAGEPVTLLVIGDGGCIEDLSRILGHSRWTVLRAHSIAEADSEMRRAGARVVVCEAALPDGTWKDVMGRALRLDPPPPVVVAAGHADDCLWMEVLNGGGYNVLGRPFREQEVFRVLSMAWLRHRESEKARARISG